MILFFQETSALPTRRHSNRIPFKCNRLYTGKMAKPPPIELLAATHVFPGNYVLKVIGSAEEWFAERVVAAVREEMMLDKDPVFKLRKTAGGKHVAVSLELHALSAQQIHDVYLRLMKIPGVILLL